jgi:Aminotransferase class I and II
MVGRKDQTFETLWEKYLHLFLCLMTITFFSISSSFSIINDEDLIKILDLPVLVVLDEAYIEFSGIKSKMDWVKKYDNLIVLRTFSKRAGIS